MMKVRRKNSPLFLETVSNRIEICHDFFQQKQSHSQVFDTRIVFQFSKILNVFWFVINVTAFRFASVFDKVA